ncbi:MAG: pyridoxal-phosphate dependent enzyme, partial [Microthrixaceae bacterium]
MSEGVRSYLAEQPRVLLGHWPTPLQPCNRLREQIGGPLIWLKRDDCTGLATGGNKTRKLEYLLGKALAEGCDGVITFGALQSNHARQTAAACAKLGLSCDLILTRAVPRSDESYLQSGNLLLDRLLGAKLHIVKDSDEAFVTFAGLYEQAQASGGKPFGIVPGGSDSTGVLGYVQGALELAEQVQTEGLDLGTTVVA